MSDSNSIYYTHLQCTFSTSINNIS